MPEGPWLTVAEAAERARCGAKVIYQAVAAGQLRAARLAGRRAIRIHRTWVDQWLLGLAAEND